MNTVIFLYSRNKNLFTDSCNQNTQLSQQILGQTVPDKLEKPHSFKLTTFKGLNWCELCANFLWGFTLQGKRCEDCGVIAHGMEKFQFKKSINCVLVLMNFFSFLNNVYIFFFCLGGRGSLDHLYLNETL